MMAIFALAVALLFAINVLHAYQLGFQSKMYDSPIYRWRESMVIALSRMQPLPLHGYVGYGSILSYFTQHGLALIGGEANPLPTQAQRAALVTDGVRMNQLMKEASEVAIDPTLPPVILQGNELGLVDYTYWAFKLYGISINALVLLYFTLLFVSVALFLHHVPSIPILPAAPDAVFGGTLLRDRLRTNPRHYRHRTAVFSRSGICCRRCISCFSS